MPKNKAQIEYRKRNKRLPIIFNRETEYDLIKHIESQPIPQASYIKNLIKDDLNSKKIKK